MLNIIKMNDSIWRIHEENRTTNPDAYLVVGNDRAVVIDALESEAGLYNTVKQLTDKPLFLLLTHGHPDHAGVGVDTFVINHCPVYMNYKDMPLLPLYCSKTQKDTDVIMELNAGDSFDLGGIVLEAFAIPGHTPGSIAFIEQKHKILFSGDSLGSGGIWMWLPECLPLSDYLHTLEETKKLFAAIPELILYPGHIGQSDEALGMDYLNDLYQLTKTILEQDGNVDGTWEHFTLPTGKYKFINTAYGRVTSYCFSPDKL